MSAWMFPILGDGKKILQTLLGHLLWRGSDQTEHSEVEREGEQRHQSTNQNFLKLASCIPCRCSREAFVLSLLHAVSV